MSYRPEILMLHDVDHGDFPRLMPHIPDLPVNWCMHSFTDTQDKPSSHNDDLSHIAFRRADYILLQSRLLSPLTAAAGLAISSSVLSSTKRAKFFEFSDDYEVSYMDIDKAFEVMDQAGEVR